MTKNQDINNNNLIEEKVYFLIYINKKILKKLYLMIGKNTKSLQNQKMNLKNSNLLDFLRENLKLIKLISKNLKLIKFIIKKGLKKSLKEHV